jgi:hypothetical protein
MRDGKRYHKKLRRLGRLMDQATNQWQWIHNNLGPLGEEIFYSETVQSMLDRWAHRICQLNEWELRKVSRRFFNPNC